jgi:hypothetical protein
MSNRPPTLTNRDHQNMDAFLGHVLEDFKSGAITKAEAIGGLAHVIAAIDIGDYGEAITWFEQGRKFIQQGDEKLIVRLNRPDGSQFVVRKTK